MDFGKFYCLDFMKKKKRRDSVDMVPSKTLKKDSSTIASRLRSSQVTDTFIPVKLLITIYITRGVLYKKVLLKISQDSQENICARVSF